MAARSSTSIDPRVSAWLLFAAPVLVLVGVAHGARPDLTLKLQQPVFVMGVAAAASTGILAAIAVVGLMHG